MVLTSVHQPLSPQVSDSKLRGILAENPTWLPRPRSQEGPECKAAALRHSKAARAVVFSGPFGLPFQPCAVSEMSGSFQGEASHFAPPVLFLPSRWDLDQVLIWSPTRPAKPTPASLSPTVALCPGKVSPLSLYPGTQNGPRFPGKQHRHSTRQLPCPRCGVLAPLVLLGFGRF